MSGGAVIQVASAHHGFGIQVCVIQEQFFLLHSTVVEQEAAGHHCQNQFDDGK